MKGYDKRFGIEPEEHTPAKDSSILMLMMCLAALAVVLALI